MFWHIYTFYCIFLSRFKIAIIYLLLKLKDVNKITINFSISISLTISYVNLKDKCLDFRISSNKESCSFFGNSPYNLTKFT